MENYQRGEFTAMLNVMMDTLNKQEMSREVIIVWWHALKQFDIQIVKAAINKWVNTEAKVPTPAQIKEMCKPMVPVYKSLPRPKMDKDRINHHLSKMYAAIGRKV